MTPLAFRCSKVSDGLFGSRAKQRTEEHVGASARSGIPSANLRQACFPLPIAQKFAATPWLENWRRRVLSPPIQSFQWVGTPFVAAPPREHARPSEAIASMLASSQP